MDSHESIWGADIIIIGMQNDILENMGSLNSFLELLRQRETNLQRTPGLRFHILWI